MVKKLKEIFDILKGEEKLILSVAAAEDKEVLKAVKDAVEKQIIEPILVGDGDKIKLISEKINFDLTGIKILNSNNIEECRFCNERYFRYFNSFKICVK